MHFLNKFPRVSWFGIGLSVAILIGGVSGYWANKTIDEYQQINSILIEGHEEREVFLESKLNQLREENRKLISKTKTYKLVKPDGTIEERTESESESEVQISESVRSEYRQRISEEISRVHQEYSAELRKVTEERKKLNVEGGVTHKRQYYIHGVYNVYGPFTIGAGIALPEPVYSLGIGIDL